MAHTHPLSDARSASRPQQASAAGHSIASLAAHGVFIAAVAFAAALVFGLIA